MGSNPELSTTAKIINSYPAGDREWAEQFHAAMVIADATPAQCEEELLAQREWIHASGESAEQLLGNGWIFGKHRVREIKSPQQLGQDELPVDSFRTLILGFGLTIGAMAVGFGLWIAFRDGWLAWSWTYWQLGCFIAGGSLALIGTGFAYLRLASRFKAAWLLLSVGLPTTVLVAVPLFMMAGEDAAIPAPNAVVPMLGLLLAVGVFFLPEASAKPHSPADEAALNLDPGLWFAQTRRILRGRYGFTRREAASVLEEARQGWHENSQEANTTDIVNDLGTPNEFAIQAAPGNAAAVHRRWMLKNCALLLLFGYYLSGNIGEISTNGISWWTAFLAFLCMLLLAYFATRLLPSQRGEHVQAKLRALQQAADAVSERQDNI